MQLRRTLATITAVLALAAPLTSCGFDYATAREYTPAAGANNRDGDVDVLSAVIVSGQEGSGTFVASLSNNLLEDDETRTLTSITGETDDVTVAEFEPVQIEPGALVNLADPAAGITVEGDFESGDFVTLTLAFDSGERAELNVPTVPNDTGVWEGLDVSGGSA